MLLDLLGALLITPIAREFESQIGQCVVAKLSCFLYTKSEEERIHNKNHNDKISDFMLIFIFLCNKNLII